MKMSSSVYSRLYLRNIKRSLIDRERDLHFIAIGLIDSRRFYFLSNPTNRQIIDIGITALGDTTDEARVKITSAFYELMEIQRRGAVVALCGAFERSFLNALANPIGEIRKIVRDRYKLAQFQTAKERFIKDIDAFEGLDAKFRILEGLLSVEKSALLKAIRIHRNEISHGATILSNQSLTIDDIADILKETLETLGIR